MSGRGRWWRAGLAQWLCAAAACAAPADDHARGLLAYQRGDVVGAMSALRPAAQAGHAPAQVLLAFILDRADFPDEAVGLYRQAAEHGDAEGHAGFANLLLTGRGIAKDEKQALEHFSKAADLGHALAIQVVADAHLKGQMGLSLPPADPARALAALRRAAEQGHLPAVEALAQAHRRGDWGLAADAAEAARWQARAAALRQQRSSSPARARP